MKTPKKLTDATEKDAARKFESLEKILLQKIKRLRNFL